MSKKLTLDQAIILAKEALIGEAYRIYLQKGKKASKNLLEAIDVLEDLRF